MVTHWKSFLLAVTVSNIINYFSIREILWSIVWLNRGGKLRKFREYKKNVQNNESIVSRISMRYLLKRVSICKKDYIIWWRVKLIFVCVEVILEITYFLVGIGLTNVNSFRFFSLFMFIQVILSFLFLRFHLGIGGHFTKYDKMRIKR